MKHYLVLCVELDENNWRKYINSPVVPQVGMEFWFNNQQTRNFSATVVSVYLEVQTPEGESDGEVMTIFVDVTIQSGVTTSHLKAAGFEKREIPD